AHAGQFTPRAPLLLRTVANTTLILQPLGCPELSGHPALAASGDTCETYSPPRHRSVRARRAGRAGIARGGADVGGLPRRPELPLGRRPSGARPRRSA